MKQIFLLIAASLMLSACAAIDPAANDLKSPCVSNGNGGEKVPCERRSPIDNFII